MRVVARTCGFPPGVGGLLSASTRARLLGSVAGSFLLSVLDMIGVLAMLPMMQFISGSPADQGALGFIYRALNNPSRTTLVTVLALLIVGAFVLKDVIALIFRRWQLHFMADQEAQTSVQLLRGYLVGPYSRHLERDTGDKVWAVGYAVTMGFSGGITAALGLLTEFLTILLIFISLIFVSPLPTLLAAAYFGVAGMVLQRSVQRESRAAGERSVTASQIVTQSSLQAFGAAKEIKLRRAEEPFVTNYASGEHTFAHARASATFLLDVPKYLLEIVFILGIGMLAFVSTALNNGQSALILLGVFVAAGSRILPSTVRLIGALSGIRIANTPLTMLVKEHTDQGDGIRGEEGRIKSSREPRGDIKVTGLTFAYPQRIDEPVLRGVDLSIPAGTSVAIVGTSGAGKSTLIDLMLGLQHPQGGDITAGNVSIFDNLPSWQRRLAVVPQEVYLLDDTLARNIAFDVEPDHAKLADVVRRAQLEDLVADLPDGLATQVGERGDRLSGGQRQRIGIARALYREPEILFLDEATSALDNDTERKLSSTIENLQKEITVVIVAHRLSTVRHCDSLIFMKNGRVENVGSFDEVVAKNVEFAHLVRLGALEPSSSS